MNKWYSFYLVYILIFNEAICQSGQAHVIQSDIDNTIYQINNIDGNITANSEDFYIFGKSNLNDIQIISRENIGSGSKEYQPLFMYKNSLDSNILCNLKLSRGEKIVFYTNFWNKNNIAIDSIVVEGNIGGYYINNPILRNNKIYILISGVFSTSTASITFLEINQSGKIKKIFSEVRDTSQVKSQLFSHRLILACTFINENRILLTGINSLVSIVDTSFNIIYFGRPVFYHNFPYYLTLGWAKTKKANDSIIYATSEFAYLTTSGSLDHLIFKLKFINDSIRLDSYAIVSNPEKLNKQYNFITSVFNNNFYTVSNPYYDVIGHKQDFNNSFYVTKFNELKEIWHKSYGGDYYYYVSDAISIDSCNIMIGGSLYDYFKNGLLQAFYAIIDCDGNIVNSNINLKEIQASFVCPNPSNGIIRLNTSHNVNRLELYNMQGKLIKSENGQYLQQLEVNGYPQGIYLIKIFYNGTYKTERVIVND